MKCLGPIGAVIAGLAIHLPQRRQRSSELDADLGKPAGWLERACGVAERPVVGPNETQEGMAAEAARHALDEAGLSIDDIDLLLFGASVGRQPIPSTAPLIKRELGALHAAFPAFDINATCLSALVAIDQAALHIAAGRARHVLVVTSEIASRALPWKTAPATAGLFGDGAAALVVSASTDEGASMRLGQAHLETYAQGYDDCALQAGGTRYDFHAQPDDFARHSYFEMDGMALYKLTSANTDGFVERLLGKARWTREEVDLVVPHQASPHALAHIAKRLGFAADRVVNIVSGMGNQVAASLPVALHEARRAGRVVRGMKVLLIGTSAGVSLGGMTLVA